MSVHRVSFLLLTFCLILSAAYAHGDKDKCKPPDSIKVKRYEGKSDNFENPGPCRGCPIGAYFSSKKCSCTDTKATWRQDVGKCVKATGCSFSLVPDVYIPAMTITSKNKNLQLQGNPNGDTSLRLSGTVVNSNAVYSLNGFTVLDDSSWHTAVSSRSSDFSLERDGGSGPYKLLYKGDTKHKKDYDGAILNFALSANQSVAGCLMIKIDGYVKYKLDDFPDSKFPLNSTGQLPTNSTLSPPTQGRSGTVTGKSTSQIQATAAVATNLNGQSGTDSRTTPSKVDTVTQRIAATTPQSTDMSASDDQHKTRTAGAVKVVPTVADAVGKGSESKITPIPVNPVRSQKPAIDTATKKTHSAIATAGTTDVGGNPEAPVTEPQPSDTPADVVGTEPLGNGNGDEPDPTVDVRKEGDNNGDNSALADKNSKESSGSSVVPAAAGGAGAALVLAIVIILVVVLGRRHRARKERTSVQGESGTLEQVFSNPVYDVGSSHTSSQGRAAGTDVDNPVYDGMLPSLSSSQCRTSGKDLDNPVYDEPPQSIQSVPLPTPPPVVGLDNPCYDVGNTGAAQSSAAPADDDYRDPSSCFATGSLQREDYEAPTEGDYEDPDVVVQDMRRISSNLQPNDDYEFVSEK